MLAGLYLSTRGMVNVEGADSVTYYGTTQDDVIDMTVRNVTDSVKVDTGKGDDRVDVRVEKRPNLEFAIELEEGWQAAFEGISSVASIEELPAGLKGVMTNLLGSIDNLVIDEALDAAPLKVDIDLGLGNDTLDFTLVDTTDLALGTPNIEAGTGEGGESATSITLPTALISTSARRTSTSSAAMATTASASPARALSASARKSCCSSPTTSRR